MAGVDKKLVNTSHYDSSACENGVVQHISFGAFHRAHQAMLDSDDFQLRGDIPQEYSEFDARLRQAIQEVESQWPV